LGHHLYKEQQNDTHSDTYTRSDKVTPGLLLLIAILAFPVSIIGVIMSYVAATTLLSGKTAWHMAGCILSMVILVFCVTLLAISKFAIVGVFIWLIVNFVVESLK
jgi:uncharacterized membrane protein